MSVYIQSNTLEFGLRIAGMRKTMMISALLMAGFAGGAEAADYDGQWARGDGNARVKIEPCGADICAINTWIKPGTPKEKKGDKLVMTIARGASGSYSGSAFDPQRDMTYKLTMTIDGNRMTTRGCVVAGLICRSVEWTRIVDTAKQ